MTSALIIGGTGIISSAIVEQLLARGVQVRRSSIAAYGSSRLSEGVRLMRGDRANALEFVNNSNARERSDAVYDSDLLHAGAKRRRWCARVRGAL